jgi:two-component system, NarL family, sensor histidine kinase UhpB
MRSRIDTSTDDDDRADRLALRRMTATVLGVFGVGAAVQAVYVLGLAVDAEGPAQAPAGGLAQRLTVNLLAVVACLVLLRLVHVHRRHGGRRALAVGGLAALVATMRVALQGLLGVHDPHTPWTLLAEAGSGTLAAAVAVTIGLVHVADRRGVREAERQRVAQEQRAAEVLSALQREELVFRREVAEGLHGTVQQDLVLLAARCRDLEGALVGDPGLAAQAGRLRTDLDLLRERGVRDLSRLLYPAGLELGAVPAIRMLLHRVPESVGTRLEATPAARAVDDPMRGGMPTDRRVLVVRVVEEAVTNAIRHGAADSIEVSLDTVTHGDGSTGLRVVVDDDGGGPPESPDLQGIARLAERLGGMGGSVRLVPRQAGGTRLEALIPVAPGSPPVVGTST